MDNKKLRDSVANDLVTAVETWIYTTLLVSEVYPRIVFERISIFDVGAGLGAFTAWKCKCRSLQDYVHLACRGLHEALLLNRVKSVIVVVYDNDHDEFDDSTPLLRYVVEFPSDICKLVAQRAVEKHGRNATPIDARSIICEPIRELLLTTERRAVTGRLDSGGSTRRGWKLMFESKPVLNPIGDTTRRVERVQDRPLKVPRLWSTATDKIKISQQKFEGIDTIRRTPLSSAALVRTRKAGLVEMDKANLRLSLREDVIVNSYVDAHFQPP